MTTLEYVNDHYDRSIITFICTATFLVMALVSGLILLGLAGTSWVLLPASWWVGGMMVWAQGKYMRTRANR